MGWTSYRATFYKNGQVDRKAEMDAYFKEEDSVNKKYHFKLLKSAMIGSTYYAAIEKTNNETKESKVFATICLTNTNHKFYDNFSYKDMDETMGPYQYKCPVSILNLLTPTTNKYAIDWRERCRAYHNKKNELAKIEKFGEKGGKIKYRPNYDLESGKKKGEEIILYYHTIVVPYKKKSKGFWTDGFYRYPTKLLMQGEVEKIET